MNHVYLPVDHDLSVKFQNTAFKVLERFNWESRNGVIPCLSIKSVLASDYATEKLGWDTQVNFIVDAQSFNLIG